jgi:hypothetical protein
MGAGVGTLTSVPRLEFADRGAHTLRGVPGEWCLFAVESP